MSELIWYVGYGSNISSERLGRYLRREVSGESSRLIHVNRDVYFAGASKTWGGGVAFMTLETSTEWSHCVAYPIMRRELARLFRLENGDESLLPPYVDLKPNEWRGALLAFESDGYQGKYNALLRLDDVEGAPAYTLTTARPLALSPPSASYLDVLVGALGEHVGPDAAKAYWDKISASQKITQPRIHFFTGRGFHWEGRFIERHTAGFPVVRLPRTLAPVDSCRMLLGHVGGAANQVFVSFDLSRDAVAQVPVGLVSLDLSSDTLTLDVDPPWTPRLLGGRAGDITNGDVVQVDGDTATLLGRWALLSTPSYCGPVRVQARSHVPLNSVRIPYAGRQLFALDKQAPIVLQRLCPATRGKRTRLLTPLRRVGEFVFGAPIVALRATEALVGDDGRKIVRADSTALDFLGVRAGEHVVVSWGDRSALARVLLQTPETALVMESQLREATGRQTRKTLDDIAARQLTPPHLRLWVSSRVRAQLAIPPDSVVRVRRSVRHMVMLSSAGAAMPMAAILIGMMAVPTVPMWVWLVSILFIAALSALPHRLRPDRD